jgi:hypothetical protein
LIAKNKVNALQAGASSIVAPAAQQPNVVMALHALMKEALCLAFSTDDMCDQRVCADRLTNTTPYSMARCKSEEERLRSDMKSVNNETHKRMLPKLQ